MGKHGLHGFQWFTLPKTNSWPLKIALLPQKGKNHLPTINFQGRELNDNDEEFGRRVFLPLEIGWFSGSMSIFRGVARVPLCWFHSKKKEQGPAWPRPTNYPPSQRFVSRLIMLVSFIASNSIVGFNFIPIVEARRGVFRSWLVWSNLCTMNLSSIWTIMKWATFYIYTYIYIYKYLFAVQTSRDPCFHWRFLNRLFASQLRLVVECE